MKTTIAAIGAIGGGDPAHEPAALSETLWRIYSDRKDFRTFVKPFD